MGSKLEGKLREEKIIRRQNLFQDPSSQAEFCSQLEQWQEELSADVIETSVGSRGQ